MHTFVAFHHDPDFGADTFVNQFLFPVSYKHILKILFFHCISLSYRGVVVAKPWFLRSASILTVSTFIKTTQQPRPSESSVMYWDKLFT
jgi:hypothetical protein